MCPALCVCPSRCSFLMDLCRPSGVCTGCLPLSEAAPPGAAGTTLGVGVGSAPGLWGRGLRWLTAQALRPHRLPAAARGNREIISGHCWDAACTKACAQLSDRRDRRTGGPVPCALQAMPWGSQTLRQRAQSPDCMGRQTAGKTAGSVQSPDCLGHQTAGSVGAEVLTSEQQGSTARLSGVSPVGVCRQSLAGPALCVASLTSGARLRCGET